MVWNSTNYLIISRRTGIDFLKYIYLLLFHEKNSINVIVIVAVDLLALLFVGSLKRDGGGEEKRQGMATKIEIHI